MWRWRELMPVRDEANIVTLGEGMTPLLPAKRLGGKYGFDRLFVKDEGLNPTGSFKARGMSAAVSRAKELGVTTIALPSAGNAAGAAAAYGAAAGMQTYVFMPEDAPEINKIESGICGAHVYLVKGLIGDAGRIVRELAPARGWFDVSTLREPYRVEGKKTLGLELAEQFNWELPDAIIYPTGGGTGIIGMWKAFEELEQLGWVSGRRPKMISVQASGCAPIVKAFKEGEATAVPWQNARTIAAGLRVPHPFADYLILRTIRESGGTAVEHSTYWHPDFERLANRIARQKAIVAIARKLLVVVWHVLTEHQIDRHGEVEQVARKFINWGTQQRTATRQGLSRAAFVRRQIDQLGLGTELEAFEYNG